MKMIGLPCARSHPQSHGFRGCRVKIRNQRWQWMQVRHNAGGVRAGVMGQLVHHLLSRFVQFTGQLTVMSKGGALQVHTISTLH